MPTLRNKLPSYRKHKASGRAVVTLGGRDHYLGAFGSAESRREYERLMTEWLLNHKNTLPGDGQGPHQASCVADLIVAYLKFADTYYIKHGKPTSMIHRVRVALRYVVDEYGTQSPSEFGPLKLKAVREKMIERRLCVTTVNEYVAIIRRMFRWGVENELVPAATLHALQAVAGLRAGRSAAPDPRPVRPVTQAAIDAVLPLVSAEVAAMIRLQLLTGMRPGEACIMRGCDIERDNKVWIYRPSRHKTQHRDRTRVVFLGPKAQAILREFLTRDAAAFLFSPVAAEARRNARRRTHEARHKSRKTNRRALRAAYDACSYRRAIERACAKANPPPEALASEAVSVAKPSGATGDDRRQQLAAWRREFCWHPNQLRHNAATMLRREYGLDQARAILGHSSPEVTAVYAEVDAAKAAEIMESVG